MLRRVCALLVLLTGVVCAQGAGQRSVSLIVTGGIVVTMDAGGRVLAPGAVAIDGRDIVAVDTPAAIAQQFTSGQTIDATGKVVMPGLINTHTHAPMVLYRGLADDLALMDWLQKYIFPAEAKTVSPEFVRAGTRLAALEMIQSGTTAYADMYYFEEEIARATKEAGIRGVLGQTIIQFPVPDAKTPAEGIARATRFIKDWSKDELIVPAIAPHSMYTLDAATLKEIRAVATREQAPVVIHLAETRDEVKVARDKYKSTPTQFLESIGFWGARTIAAHGVHVTPADIQILAKRHVGLSHNPESNMKLASGTSPVLGHAEGRRRRRPRDRWRGEQQRPRHVRGNAPGGVPAQAHQQQSERHCRQRQRCGWQRSMAPACSGWIERSARSRRASGATCWSCRCARRARRRCTIRCHTWCT